MPLSSVMARLRHWFSPALLRRTVAALLLAVGFLGGIAWGSWTRVCANSACPSIAILDDYRPQQTSKVYAMDGRLTTPLGPARRNGIRIQDMPEPLRQAFIAI